MPKDPIAARREYSGPALFSFGFRPFFLFGALWAALSAPLWMHAYAGGDAMVGAAPALAWHIHEMLFGFIAAIVAGFLLTAVPNWTGRLPVMGWPLAGLFALWAAGRAAMLFYAELGIAAAVIDSAFLVVLVGLLGREVVTGGNAKNVPVIVFASLFALANICFHAALLFGLDWRPAQGVAIAVIAMLIALIGGRIVPSFTRNWLVQQGQSDLPAPMGLYDRASLLALAVALVLWIALPFDWFTGAFLLIAGAMHTGRVVRWKGWKTTAEPLVLILHVGYAWLPLALVLMGLSMIAPVVVPASAALHALTAGAMGTMTLAVMTRASLGHTGRERTADLWTSAIYVLVVTGALIRVVAPVALGPAQFAALGVSAMMWSSAFALFFVRYGPILMGPRKR
ncbi:MULTISPECIES: NnrS family protein [Marinicauda]|uniref:NnrS family protein n=1 Tax=Marinicauda pacifica TaxID=1133559 RepID=A0A4S2H9Z1_9PROT|nr:MULTISPECIES: NnrS family protein [Marinicauda]TGY92252.1 NnrS family protein [Marinicauda pacifica]